MKQFSINFPNLNISVSQFSQFRHFYESIFPIVQTVTWTDTLVSYFNIQILVCSNTINFASTAPKSQGEDQRIGAM
jgi:hypothetical protein